MPSPGSLVSFLTAMACNCRMSSSHSWGKLVEEVSNTTKGVIEAPYAWQVRFLGQASILDWLTGPCLPN